MTLRVRGPWPGVPEARRAIMRANRRRDTGPELAIRSLVHRAGLRFRVDYPVKPPGHRSVRPDIVFPARRIAIYVDGCFWHCCPIHGSRPATNTQYWDGKLAANAARDARVTEALEGAGWTVVRFWEHEDASEAATRIVALVRGSSISRENGMGAH
jgi:DNA mismatch endonuclease (patch repair protein)